MITESGYFFIKTAASPNVGNTLLNGGKAVTNGLGLGMGGLMTGLMAGGAAYGVASGEQSLGEAAGGLVGGFALDRLAQKGLNKIWKEPTHKNWFLNKLHGGARLIGSLGTSMAAWTLGDYLGSKAGHAVAPIKRNVPEVNYYE